MNKKVPDIGAHTADASKDQDPPARAAVKRHLQVGMTSMRNNWGAATERARASGKGHAGWFHRSGPGKVQWIPAEGGGLRTASPESSGNRRDLPAAAPVSGPYPVVEVAGGRPAGLPDFLGVTSFVVLTGDRTQLVFGTGRPSPDGVSFRQQDLGFDGREIRTWLITTAPDGIVADPGSSV